METFYKAEQQQTSILYALPGITPQKPTLKEHSVAFLYISYASRLIPFSYITDEMKLILTMVIVYGPHHCQYWLKHQFRHFTVCSSEENASEDFWLNYELLKTGMVYISHKMKGSHTFCLSKCHWTELNKDKDCSSWKVEGSASKCHDELYELFTN